MRGGGGAVRGGALGTHLEVSPKTSSGESKELSAYHCFTHEK